MTDVLLFHHALGVTPGIGAIADELRGAGHDVAVPDLFEGATFGSVEAGIAHADEVGFDTIIERGVDAAQVHDGGLVVVGFSLGVLPAQKLAQTRAGVVGAVLCHAAIPLGEFADDWPSHVAVQIHMVEHDPWVEEDLDAAREIASTAFRGELFLYPGTGHLVADKSAPEYDPVVGRKIIERILGFVDNPTVESA
ncbi:MAG: dienelactone hydrolase family protein [Acidimicrobiales bacterium]